MSEQPNGAEAAFRAAAAAGVQVCFANPGTTEMQMVAALDEVPAIRPVLGLFEGVCTGAADGYGRMTDRPALTVLHLGPGFANGIANLHNARRAHSPVVNLVGDHATWHLAADAPLTSDIESLAAPVSLHVRRTTSADHLANDVADAVALATGPPSGVVTVIVPQDTAWSPAEHPDDGHPTDQVAGPAAAADPDDADVARAAGALSAEGSVMLLGGWALRRPVLEEAARVAAATGCRLFAETFPARVEQGAGIPHVPTLPYFPEQAVAALEGAPAVVLVGAHDPVAFFGYPGHPSRLVPEGCEVIDLAPKSVGPNRAVHALADLVGGDTVPAERRPVPDVPEGEGPLDIRTMGQALAALQPEGAIVVNEAATSGLPWAHAAPAAAPHDVLALTGGAIGQGLPCAVGAAIACPDRKVIAFEADGSGMYTLQSLWTMARERLDVVVVIAANQRYKILQHELRRAGVEAPGPASRSLTDLGQPGLDWVSLAAGMGVDAVSVDRVDPFVAELGGAIGRPGPFLVEARI